jgi:putative DNA primase/helicase
MTPWSAFGSFVPFVTAALQAPGVMLRRVGYLARSRWATPRAGASVKFALRCGEQSEMWIEPDFDGILPELKAVPNWVLAREVVRDGKKTKPPFQPNGKLANHSDLATWSDFAAVKERYERGGYIGVGFVLDGKPHFSGRYLHGFDWDRCIENGVIDPIVDAQIEALAIPRKEISISGTGFRGFFLHDEPLTSRRTKIDGRSVELYSTLRYMTTTGVGSGALT